MKTSRLRYPAPFGTWMVFGVSLSLLGGCGPAEDADGSGLNAEEITCSSDKAAGDYCGVSLTQSLAAASDASLSTATAFDSATGRNASFGIKEYLFRYKTQIKPDGVTELIDATGVLLIPEGTAPAGGFPVLMWAHGAVGGADQCAPSSDSVAALESTARHYAARGFMVVAPDYAGLGVDDVPHFFLVKEPTAYSVLDSIHAAIQYAEDNSISVNKDKVVMLGLSQGGQAVLFAHEYYDGSEAYRANDFTLVGSASLAPAPAWKNALFAAQVYASALPGSLAAFAASYLHSASLYQSSLDAGVLMSTADLAAIEAGYESKCTAELATGTFSTTLSSFATAAMQNVVGMAFAGFACYLTGDSGSTPMGIPANMCGALNTTFSLSGGSTAAASSITAYPDQILAASGSAAWAAQMVEDSPASGLAGSTIPIRMVQGMLDTTVSPYMTVPLMHSMLMSGNYLAKSDGSPITTDFATAVSGALVSCNSDGTGTPTDVIACDAGHSGATGILNKFSMYSDWVFDRAGL